MRLLNSVLLCSAIGVAVLFTACKKPAAAARIDPNDPVEVVIPDHGVYTGAFMDFGDEEDDVTLETIEDFEQMVGKHQTIIVSSSYWGEQNFPVDNLNVIWRHGSLRLIIPDQITSIGLVSASTGSNTRMNLIQTYRLL